MVSQKLVIVLITVAILLSLVSIVVTVATINSDLVPEAPKTRVVYGDIASDYERGQVQIQINKDLETQ